MAMGRELHARFQNRPLWMGGLGNDQTQHKPPSPGMVLETVGLSVPPLGTKVCPSQTAQSLTPSSGLSEEYTC